MFAKYNNDAPAALLAISINDHTKPTIAFNDRILEDDIHPLT